MRFLMDWQDFLQDCGSGSLDQVVSFVFFFTLNISCRINLMIRVWLPVCCWSLHLHCTATLWPQVELQLFQSFCQYLKWISVLVVLRVLALHGWSFYCSSSWTDRLPQGILGKQKRGVFWLAVCLFVNEPITRLIEDNVLHLDPLMQQRWESVAV